MGKPKICICENKDVDQLRSNCEADQRHGKYHSVTFLIQNLQPLTIYCDCTARFVSDLDGTQILDFLTHRLKYDFNICAQSLCRATSFTSVYTEARIIDVDSESN